MKLFQSQTTCMYGYPLYVGGGGLSYPSLIYPNGGGYCYHDFIEIEFFTCGSGIHHLNSIPYRVRSGYFYLLMPGDYHYYSLDESEQFQLYNIKLDVGCPRREIMELLTAYSRPYAVYLEGEEYETTLHEVELLNDYWRSREQNGAYPADDMAQNIAERIILLLIRNLGQPERSVVSSVPPKIRNITAYIDRHYKEPITVAEMAETTGLTPHYFSDYFKKQFGIGFCDYVNRVRLFRAIALFDTTDLSVKEISAAVGFHSQAYFSRMFTKQFEISPSEYRKSKGK